MASPFPRPKLLFLLQIPGLDKQIHGRWVLSPLSSWGASNHLITTKCAHKRYFWYSLPVSQNFDRLVRGIYPHDVTRPYHLAGVSRPVLGDGDAGEDSPLHHHRVGNPEHQGLRRYALALEVV